MLTDEHVQIYFLIKFYYCSPMDHRGSIGTCGAQIVKIREGRVLDVELRRTFSDTEGTGGGVNSR